MQIVVIKYDIKSTIFIPKKKYDIKRVVRLPMVFESAHSVGKFFGPFEVTCHS